MIGEATLYLPFHNSTLLQMMEEVFAENLEMVETLKDTFDVEPMVTLAIKVNISSQATKQILDNIRTHDLIEDTSET